MGHILARIKTRKATNLRIAISNINAYDIPTLDNVTEYNDEMKLDDDQWFRISEFSQKEYCPEYIKNDLNFVEVANIGRDEFEKIKFLISYQNDNYFLFQRLLTSSILKRQKFLAFQDEPQLKENQTIVIINTLPDTICAKDTDCLYFKDLPKIAPIFKGIDVLFEEATDDEVDIFLELDLVTVVAEFAKQKVSKSNRKRIRNALHQYNAMSDNDKIQLREYIKRYCPNLRFDNNSNTFELGSDNDCKNLIFGIDQRYYTTIVGNQDRMANSITPI